MNDHLLEAPDKNLAIQPPSNHPAWTLTQRVGFRFSFSFFMLFIVPFPLSYIPYSYQVFKYYHQFWEWITIQVGTHILDIGKNLKNTPTGSGDSIYDWTHAFTFLLVAGLATLVWSVLDRKRPAYRRLLQCLLLGGSYYLAMYMFTYGFAKLFYLQFVPPNLERLFQTYGQSSPMRLVWTFMGASQTYTMFGGASEIIAGLLLVFRPTRVLGGLVTFGVMLNVFLMNMSYDIPVKLFSFQLMVMGLLVALIDYQRLWGVLVSQKNVLPATFYQPMFTRMRHRRILWTLQLLLVGYIVYGQIKTRTKYASSYGVNRDKHALYGVYEVEKFVKNRQTLPPMLTDTVRWRRLLMDYPERISVMQMDDRMRRYSATTDTLKKQMTLHLYRDTVNKYVLKYEHRGKAKKDLKLSGILQKDTIEVHLKHYPLENFLLLNRGFHWVNEVPYNRYGVKN